MPAIILSLLLSLTPEASAAPYFGFCAKGVTSGVECTNILSSTTTDIAGHCALWSSGAPESSVITDPLYNNARQLQVENCNYVAGQRKYACFARTTCRGSTTTRPIPGSFAKEVFAPNAKAAAKSCLAYYGDSYRRLARTLPFGCTYSAYVVEVLP